MHKNLYKKSVLLQKPEINPINCLEIKDINDLLSHRQQFGSHIWYYIFFQFQLNVLLAIFPFPHAQKVKANSVLNCIISIQSSYILEGRHYTYSIILILVCNCNSDGSIGATCDDNGQCNCKAGFFSIRCEEGTIFIIM